MKVKFYWISLQISIQDSIYTHCFCCNESQEAMKYPLYDLKNAAVHSILFSNSLHQQFCSQAEQKWIEPIVGTTCSWIILSCSHNSALRFSRSEAFCTKSGKPCLSAVWAAAIFLAFWDIKALSEGKFILLCSFASEQFVYALWHHMHCFLPLHFDLFFFCFMYLIPFFHARFILSLCCWQKELN